MGRDCCCQIAEDVGPPPAVPACDMSIFTFFRDGSCLPLFTSHILSVKTIPSMSSRRKRLVFQCFLLGRWKTTVFVPFGPIVFLPAIWHWNKCTFLSSKSGRDKTKSNKIKTLKEKVLREPHRRFRCTRFCQFVATLWARPFIHCLPLDKLFRSFFIISSPLFFSSFFFVEE